MLAPIQQHQAATVLCSLPPESLVSISKHGGVKPYLILHCLTREIYKAPEDPNQKTLHTLHQTSVLQSFMRMDLFLVALLHKDMSGFDSRKRRLADELGFLPCRRLVQ